MAQRPSRKLVRLVLLLRAVWLVPVTLIAVVYAGNSLAGLLRLLRLPTGAFSLQFFFGVIFGLALGAAFLFFTWRIWRKTWDIMVDRVVPEPSAVWWQLVWVALFVLLPYFLVWPHLKDLARYSGEGANKGSLSLLKQAAEDYRAAAGKYPADLEELRLKGFIKAVPRLWDHRLAGFPHGPTDAAAVYRAPEPLDSGGWAYSAAGDSAPDIFIDCTHKDSRGVAWSAY